MSKKISDLKVAISSFKDKYLKKGISPEYKRFSNIYHSLCETFRIYEVGVETATIVNDSQQISDETYAYFTEALGKLGDSFNAAMELNSTDGSMSSDISEEESRTIAEKMAHLEELFDSIIDMESTDLAADSLHDKDESAIIGVTNAQILRVQRELLYRIKDRSGKFKQYQEVLDKFNTYVAKLEKGDNFEEKAKAELFVRKCCETPGWGKPGNPMYVLTEDEIQEKRNKIVEVCRKKKMYGAEPVISAVLDAYISQLTLRQEKSHSTKGNGKEVRIPGRDISAIPFFCFDGPPGTGKTTIMQIIAEAMGRELFMQPIGGSSSANLVYGRNFSWKDPEPSLVISAMIKTGTEDPVVALDELEKLVTKDY